MNYFKLRKIAPWFIPLDAKMTLENKQGYRQIKYVWYKNSWRYEARFHTKTPKAQLITYPSWRLDRIRPGKGFGPDHASRIEESLVGTKWIKSSIVRYCARQVSHGVANKKQIEIIKKAHFRARLRNY
ncbi:hypothetical protein [Lactobacillus ultunensis]|uniref:hypothetical protein n=1 Tax=Lactobacillus ultunensis TaxID=227945 RepID=UPI0002EB2B45|nr:hypothetical protein [Lactobacillus ultunensis]KRL80337.1 hypothetical protein FC57_GL001369 [Lactobacillus ultunensis DSM 16047]QQP27775.1 hypothetical protein H4B44_06465 [Lactobacillus ultunensis]